MFQNFFSTLLTLLTCKLECFSLASLILNQVSNAKAYPSGTRERYSTAPLTLLKNIRLGCKRLAGANASLLISSVSNEEKKSFKDDTRGQRYKTFLARNIQIFVIS
jgi:hypothetical protein